MTERNSETKTLILVAMIGAIGVILAACIGLIPIILPFITQQTSTPTFIFFTETSTPTDTPVPDTATVTLTPTDPPTLTATLEPLPTDTPITETPTITVTSIPPASDMEAYMGTWVNVKSEPSSDEVRLVLSRIEISQTGDATANFSACRLTPEGNVRYVEPNPAPASIYVLGLGARDFIIPNFPDLRWAIVVQRTADQIVATVQEYDMNNILIATDTFFLEKAGLLSPANLLPCQDPTVTQ
jgi:hypothetical protein